MRALPLDMAAMPAIVTIQKALETIRFTTWSTTLTVDGEDYPPAPGADVTGIQIPADGTPGNADINIHAEVGGIVEPGDGSRGVLDEWPITLSLVDPTALLAYPVLVGVIGSVDDGTNGIATIAINGETRKMLEAPLCEHYEPLCYSDLGDDRCKIPLLLDKTIGALDIGRSQEFVRPDIATGLLAVADAYGRFRTGSTVEDYANVYYECTTAGTTDTVAPAYSQTIGATVTDGTAQFIVRNGWSRYARGEAVDAYTIQFTALPDPRASDRAWYVDGGLFVRSGALSGFPKFIIVEWDPDTLMARLGLPVSVTDIPTDTQFEIHPGCIKTREICNSKFLNTVNPSGTNIENQFAFTFVPPPDFGFSF